MKPLISIIIPTCNSYDDLLKPCVESIMQYTDLHNVEIIVVNNDERNRRQSTKFARTNLDIKLISYPKKMGFPFAVNRGIEIAQGEYIMLLNNDVIILEQPKNDWINKLILPFFLDETVGITGVFKKAIPEINRKFLLFFCCLIHKSVFDKIGLLDEGHGIGYMEDAEFCLRAEDSGFKILQVPSEEEGIFDGKQYLTDFPLWHNGRQTMNHVSDEAIESYDKNYKKLISKYAQ